MHGTGDCDRSCGSTSHRTAAPPASTSDIRFNSFFYTSDNAFKLRGMPERRRAAWSRTCSRTPFLDRLPTGPRRLHRVHHDRRQSGSASMRTATTGAATSIVTVVDDLFLATGQTWWFRSGGDRHWIYLNTSQRAAVRDLARRRRRRRPLRRVANGVVSSGGTGRISKRIADLVWRATTGSLAIWEMSGGTVAAQTVAGHRAGDVAARRRRRSARRRAATIWCGATATGSLTLWEMAGGRKVAEARAQAPGYTFQGSGDFDADGADDLLWRDAAGRLVIWFNGSEPGGRGCAGGARVGRARRRRLRWRRPGRHPVAPHRRMPSGSGTWSAPSRSASSA